MSTSANTLFRFLGALGAGIITVFAIQIPLTRLWRAAGVEWGPENLPLTLTPQIAALSTLFLAILGSGLVAAWIARTQTVRVLTLLALLGVGIDGYFMFIKVGDALPLWFRVTFVTLIPLATLLAWMMVRGRVGMHRA